MAKNNITFVIPAYNSENYLREAVDSIYNENFVPGDEVIIIDDASNDQTLKIAENLKEKYESVEVIPHRYNKGTAAAGRNTGIAYSKNDLIFSLDADNILAKNSIPKLKEALLQGNADSAAFGEIWFFKEESSHL